MTLAEFSNEFDVLYNNISSNQAPGLNEYEKSVFLTKAQLEVLKNYFNPRGNKYEEGFDDSAKRQIDFSKLVTVSVCNASTDNSVITIHPKGKVYALPTDVLIILNEFIYQDNQIVSIIPINYEEYAKLMFKPYKLPPKNHGWRLLQSVGESFLSEVVLGGVYTNSTYKVRYVRRPRPIILEDFTSDGLSIDGKSEATTCELDPILHPEILQRAVEIAKSAYTGDLQSSVELGNRSE